MNSHTSEQKEKEEKTLPAQSKLADLKSFIELEFTKLPNILEPSLKDHIVELDTATVKSELDYIFNGSEIKIDSQLKEFLQTRWDAIKGTYFSYTAQPSSVVTQICCAIAEYLPENGLSLLMPGIKHYTNHASRDDIRELPLNQICLHYIISDDLESLIPIDLLTQLDLALDISRVLVNPFKDPATPLSDNEQYRLIHHSLITEELVTNKEAYAQKAAEEINLFTELKKLVAALRKGGVKGLSGGTEKYATPVAGKALESFREFWSKLTLEQKMQAENSSSEFKKTLHNNILNFSWAECVDQLATEIELYLPANRVLFVTITLDEKQHGEMLQLYQEKFNSEKELLNKMLDPNLKNVHQANDKLFLSLAQIKKLVHKEFIKNYTDVTLILKNLQPKEIETLCNDFSVEIVATIPRVDELIMILLFLNQQQIEVFARIIYGKLANMDQTLLAHGINMLCDAQATGFLEGASDTYWISESIHHSFRELSENKFNLYLQICAPSFVTFIFSIGRLKMLLQDHIQTDDRRKLFLKAIVGAGLDETKLAGMAASVTDFKFLMTLENKDKILAATSDDKLFDITNTVSQVQDILLFLTDARQNSFLLKMESKLNKLNFGAMPKLFENILALQPEDKKNSFIENQAHVLMCEIVPFNLVCFLNFLGEDVARQFLKAINDKVFSITGPLTPVLFFYRLPNWVLISDGTDSVDSKLIKPKFEELAKNTHDLTNFKVLWGMLDKEDQSKFLELMRDKLISLIKDKSGWGEIVGLIHQLPGGVSGFYTLGFIDNDNKDYYLNALNTSWLNASIITSADYNKLLAAISPNKFKKLAPYLLERNDFDKLIESKQILKLTLANYANTLTSQSALIKKLRNKMSDFIKIPDDYVYIVQIFNEYRYTFNLSEKNDPMVQKLIDVTNSFEDFKKIHSVANLDRYPKPVLEKVIAFSDFDLMILPLSVFLAGVINEFIEKQVSTIKDMSSLSKASRNYPHFKLAILEKLDCANQLVELIAEPEQVAEMLSLLHAPLRLPFLNLLISAIDSLLLNKESKCNPALKLAENKNKAEAILRLAYQAKEEIRVLINKTFADYFRSDRGLIKFSFFGGSGKSFTIQVETPPVTQADSSTLRN